MQDDQEPGYEAPVNPIPPVIVILALIVICVEAAFSLATAGVIGGVQGIGWRSFAVSDYAFSPAVLTLITEQSVYSLDVTRRLVTYPFVQPSFTNALFGAAMLLALGKFVAERFNAFSVLIVFFTATIIGAVVFAAFAAPRAPLIGIQTPLYGLIGAYSYIVWRYLGQIGQNQLRAFQLIGVLLALQLIFAMLFGGSQMWIAEVSGFVAGLAVSPLVAPGGWQDLLQRLRSRS